MSENEKIINSQSNNNYKQPSTKDEIENFFKEKYGIKIVKASRQNPLYIDIEFTKFIDINIEDINNIMSNLSNYCSITNTTIESINKLNYIGNMHVSYNCQQDQNIKLEKEKELIKEFKSLDSYRKCVVDYVCSQYKILESKNKQYKNIDGKFKKFKNGYHVIVQNKETNQKFSIELNDKLKIENIYKYKKDSTSNESTREEFDLCEKEDIRKLNGLNYAQMASSKKCDISNKNKKICENWCKKITKKSKLNYNKGHSR